MQFSSCRITVKLTPILGILAGVIGCVDGSHIPIEEPVNNPSSYVNRKGFHSMLLQGVCNEQLQQFIDCYAGEVGSIHDACMLRRSELFGKLQPNSQHFPPETHLLGDPAHPLMERLLVAFKDNGQLTRREQIFNTRLTTARCFTFVADVEYCKFPFSFNESVFSTCVYELTVNISYCQ